MINSSLMVGLNQADLQAVVNSYNLEQYYYPTLFPLRETSTLSWRMLEAQSGLKVAADIVARGGHRYLRRCVRTWPSYKGIFLSSL